MPYTLNWREATGRWRRKVVEAFTDVDSRVTTLEGGGGGGGIGEAPNDANQYTRGQLAWNAYTAPADGEGWTGGSYDSGSGIVTFTSDDALGFATGDLRGADGTNGTNGTNGTDGADGADGAGLPTGGTAGQIIEKINGTDFNTQWITPPTTYYLAVQDDGANVTATTTSFVTFTDWDTPTIEQTTGLELTVQGTVQTNVAGMVEISCQATSIQTANNRHQLDVVLQVQPSGGTWTDLVGSSNYASRNNTGQDKGTTGIYGFLYDAGSGDKFRMRVRHVGVAGIVGASGVSGQTYITAQIHT